MIAGRQWAGIKRMAEVEDLSQREIQRRTGLHRKTTRRALRSPEPPIDECNYRSSCSRFRPGQAAAIYSRGMLLSGSLGL